MLSGETQLPHTYAPGTGVDLHAHIIPMANGAGNIAIDYQVAAVALGDELPALSGWTTGTATLAVTAADQYKHKVIEIVDLDDAAMAAIKVSSILLMRIARNVATDTYETGKDHGTAAANVGILSIDWHYQQVRLGTETEDGQ